MRYELTDEPRGFEHKAVKVNFEADTEKLNSVKRRWSRHQGNQQMEDSGRNARHQAMADSVGVM